MTVFLRIIKFALRNVVRNVWLSTATVLILMLTLFSLVLLGAVNLIGRSAISAIEGKVDVTAFFFPEVTEAEVKTVQDEFRVMPQVASIDYVSREQALVDFRAANANNPVISETLDVLEENPLGANLVLHARSIDDFAPILAKLESPAYAKLISKQDFQDHQTLIDRLSVIRTKMQQFGVAITAVFIFIAILVIYTTVRMTIYSQREEIGIMRLVGATSLFIRGPYIVEGVVYALIATLATAGLVYPFLRVAGPRLQSFFEGYDLNLLQYYNEHLLAIGGLLFIVSLFLAIVSSMVAMGRYLKV